jgi:deoxyribonucleoside regulator
MSYDTNLMIKVATLYYKDKLSQLKIGQKLKISKYQVIRLLKMAEKNNVVQINIIDPVVNLTDLEDELENRFELSRVIVVENKGLSDTELRSKLGQVASKYLLEIIKEEDIIGISWGSTLNEVINNLPSKINRNIEVVQVVGANLQSSIQLSSHDIAKRFAQKFGVEPLLLFAPAIVGDKKIRNLLINDLSMKKIFDYFKKINMVIFGIGTLTSEAFLKSGLITDTDINFLEESHAVGDVINHFLNIEGKICYKDLEDRLIAIPAQDLKKVPYRIAVAGGSFKSEIILGAIRGKYLNILITDQTAAEKILKIKN